MNKMNKKGFTLIEMLVVIAIIAVLVAIIIPTVTSATDKAAAASNAANLRSIKAEIVTDILTSNLELTDSAEDNVASDVTEACASYFSGVNFKKVAGFGTDTEAQKVTYNAKTNEVYVTYQAKDINAWGEKAGS